MSFQQRVERHIRVAWNWSAASAKQEPIFRGILKQNPGPVVEIGTHQGVSTALIAQHAPVSTFDVLPNADRRTLWRGLRVMGQITSEVHKSRAGLDAGIRQAARGANLAFIDGGHLAPDVAHDFELVSDVPTIVFHDYRLNAEDWPDVRAFVDALPRDQWTVEIRSPFAIVKRA